MTSVEEIVINNASSFAKGYSPDMRLGQIAPQTALDAASILLHQGYEPMISWYACDPDSDNSPIALGISNHLEFRSPENTDALQDLFEKGIIVGPAIHIDRDSLTFSIARGIALWMQKECD